MTQMSRLCAWLVANPNKPVLLIAFILLGSLLYTAAKSDGIHPVVDINGTPYPELCRHYKLKIPHEVWTMPMDRKWLGQYYKPGVLHPTKHIIAVNSLTYRDKVTHAAIVQHELCHAIMWEITGNADWH